MENKKNKENTEEYWKGKTLVDLCSELGNPDLIESSEYYSAKFSEGTPTVTITYHLLKKRWYLDKDAIIIGVIAIKE